MPPQPRSGIKPNPTMLSCYVPNLVFTLIRDDPKVLKSRQIDMVRVAWLEPLPSIPPQRENVGILVKWV